MIKIDGVDWAKKILNNLIKPDNTKRMAIPDTIKLKTQMVKTQMQPVRVKTGAAR